MHTIFVSNGKCQLVIKPETELERAQLKELMGKGPVTVDVVNDNYNILDVNVGEALIIRNQPVTREG